MKLSRMQDVGGCRAVVNSVGEVEELNVAHLTSRMKHRLVQRKDYINNPQQSGYRGVHLVYRYRSDRNDTHNGLLIEVQLRSKLQHAWATAVETASAFLGQALKSSEGEADWLRFFAMASSVFALREVRRTVPGTPLDDGDLHAALREYAFRLGVVQRLRQYRRLIESMSTVMSRAGAHYFLLERRPDRHTLYVNSYRRNDFDKATEDYAASEERTAHIPGADAVLVSVNSIRALKRAYPNYWLDTKVFLQELQPILRPSLQ